MGENVEKLEEILSRRKGRFCTKVRVAWLRFFYELEGFIHIAQYWLHPGTIRVLLNTHNCFYYNQTKVKVS